MDRMTVQTTKFEMQNNILPFQNMTHQTKLTPGSKQLLVKLTVAQQVEKSVTCYGTRTQEPTTWPLFHPDESILYPQTILLLILILSSHLQLFFLRSCLALVYPAKILQEYEYVCIHIAAYKPVAKWWLCKQRPFLGDDSVNTFPLQRISTQQ
jgi:hypothetical protein